MVRLGNFISKFYRFFIVSVVVGLHAQIQGMNQSDDIIMAAVLFVYAFAFSVLWSSKWVAYIELFVVLGLAMYFGEMTLYFLLVNPITYLSNAMNKWYDLGVFAVVIATFSHYIYENLIVTATVFMAVVIYLAQLYARFNQVGYLEKDLAMVEKEKKDKENELHIKKTEAETISKLLIKTQELLKETIDEDALIDLAVESAKDFFDAQYTSFHLVDEEEGIIKVRELGDVDKLATPENITYEEIENNYVKDGEIQYVLENQGEDWGVLKVIGKRQDVGNGGLKTAIPFEKDDYTSLVVFGEQIITKLKSIRIGEKDRFLANHDFLTGLPNRKFFMDKFTEFSDMAERGDEFSLMVVDIDHFKHFNDTYGHDQGDEVLKIVADTMDSATRKVDFVGRMGGEEFGVLLYKPKKETEEVAERMRRLISKIPSESKITVSIGISFFGEEKDGTHFEELFKKADRALYYSKETGRNRVTLFRDIEDIIDEFEENDQ